MSHPAPQRMPSEISSLPPWSLATLWRMDWKRFQELVSLVLARSGMGSEVLWVRPDGTTVLTVVKGRGRAAGEALVQCAGWNSPVIGPQEMKQFFKAVIEQGSVRGIFITPGGFDPQALALARDKKLETIDGTEFLRTISRLTAEEQATLQRMSMSGSWDVPSCPVCGGKLEYLEKKFPKGDASKDLRDLTYRESKQVGNRVFCRHLVIKPGANVLFLKGVEAETIHVEGRIMGNIVCRGKLTVANHATVSGLVAARSIKLETGGLLEAESRILDAGEIEPVVPQPLLALWSCPVDRCHGSLPLRTVG